MTCISRGSQLGPYQIEDLIGKGGMGEVYRAHDTRLDRHVALKVLAPQFTTDADRLARFTQEARTTALLNHPNVIAVYDVGTHQGIPFVVSELLVGETLRARISGGPVPLRTAIVYGLELARGLIAAHRLNIVHRDLKPENVFVTRDDRVKILDFGLATCHEAALACADPESSTSSGRVGMVGTIGYAAPEQIRGGAADHRSDIFSFGVILYEMIAGRPPFHGTSAIDTVIAILHDEPRSIGERRFVPRALDDLVHHCLEKHAAARFQSAHDLAFSLDSVRRSLDEPAPAPARGWRERSHSLLGGRLATLFPFL
jgi:eukaryotic-like serine/threonine-protein kinase